MNRNPFGMFHVTFSLIERLIKLRREWLLAGVLVALALGVTRSASAQEIFINEPVPANPTIVSGPPRDEVTQTDSTFATVAGTVRLGNGSTTRTSLTLVNTVTGQFFSTTSQDGGTYQFTDLPAGEYGLFAQNLSQNYFPGVKRRRVNAGQVWRADIVLDKQEPVVEDGAGMSFTVSFFGELQGTNPSVYARIEAIERLSDEESGESGDSSDRDFRLELKVDQYVRGNRIPERVKIRKSFQKDEPIPVVGQIVFVTLQRRDGELSPLFLVPVNPTGAKARHYAEFVRLTRHRTPKRKELIEWLVRGAVDPESRAAAAYEIQSAIEGWGSLTSQPALVATDPFNLTADGPDFLSPSQKNRLTRALVETRNLEERDRKLIELVYRFDRPALISFLVRYLRENADVPANGLALEMLAGATENGQIENFNGLSVQIEESRQLDLYGYSSKDGKPLDEEAVKVEARKRAREELTALVRAALWAYDHPETQEAGQR